MKILFFVPQFPPTPDENGNVAVSLLAEYAKMGGLEIDVITASADGSHQQEQFSHSITIHRVPSGVGKFSSAIYVKQAYALARQLMGSTTYDLTHAFSTIPCGNVCLKLKKKFAIPYLVSLRWSDLENKQSDFPFLSSLFAPSLQTIWKSASFVVAPNYALRNAVGRIDTTKDIEVIHDGIQADSVGNIPREREQQEGMRIVTGPQLTPSSGVRFLVKAMEALAVQYPDIRLDIVGDGEEMHSLQDLVMSLSMQKHVGFLGEIEPSDLLKVLSCYDVCALPTLEASRVSTFMLDALAAGLAIVTTDAFCEDEYVRDGVNGLFVGKGDNADLERKLGYLGENPQAVANMGKESRLVADDIIWEKIAAQYVRFYSEVRNLRVLGRN